MSTAVVWFRRDLRIHDHPALAEAAASGDRVAPLFVVDERLTGPRNRFHSPNRLWFLRGSLLVLEAALAELGAPLAVLRGDPAALVPAFAAHVGAGRVLASRDLTPYGRARDDRVRAALGAIAVAWEPRPGLLVHEPESVVAGGGGGYRVFGPFERTWRSLPLRPVVGRPGPLAPAARPWGDTAVADAFEPVSPTADPGLLPEPGEVAGRGRLDRWASSGALEVYAEGRDRLDLDGSSRLGQDLRFGLLSPAEVHERIAGPGEGRRRYASELAWRDFYAHLLWREPRAARASFRAELDAVAWERDPAIIEAWRRGTTGYPAVDAAMRQLLATGWMPNRARMIVASFLTKHLGVDWRVGEAHFMAHLVDGDPASNNGGWQWAASTGTDAQPWFRVFNPTLQGLRHDPQGDYVRRWVPELRGIPGPAVHTPPRGAYRSPIVDHARARERALARYRAAAASRGPRVERPVATGRTGTAARPDVGAR